MALTSLSTFCAINLGGLQKIQYVPITWVDKPAFRRIISGAWNWQEEIPLSEGEWLEAFSISNRKIWDEKQQQTEFGNYFSQQITGILPGMRPEVAGILEEMSEYRYILKLNARNQNTWLIGSPDEGLEFSADGSTSEANGLNAYSISWSGNTVRRAYGYAPIL